MKARHAFAAAVVAAALVATVVVATGSATRGGSSVRTQTLTLIEGEEGSFGFVDNDPESSRSLESQEGPEISAGDVFTIATELLTKTKRHAGWLHATCTATVGADDFDHSRFHCTGTIDLRGGTLALSGLPDFRRRVTQIAVVGGTGAYVGVRGAIESATRRDGTSVDTVRLQR